MSSIAVEVEGLSKRYDLGERQPYYRATELIAALATVPWRMARKSLRALPERLRRLRAAPLGPSGPAADSPAGPPAHADEFWALRDVSFQVPRGEVLGVIGRNGAGKSTLLKILSRITEPTRGRAVVRGRVGSLLEVGTGFHPELTGRENVYLNGAILGMTRAEIRAKFDQIVQFAEVAQFLDTPVKRYSSGMYMRLAFAVAAHLEPEILIVDEVLAVGDAGFQKKCLGRMGEVARGGRTVLFVSHNMAAVRVLCHSAILMADGTLRMHGLAASCVSSYLATAVSKGNQRVWSPSSAPGNDAVRLIGVRIGNLEGDSNEHLYIDRPIIIETRYVVQKAGIRLSTGLHVSDDVGTIVFSTANRPSACTRPDDWFDRPAPRGTYVSRCQLPAEFLNEGRYSVTVRVYSDVSNVEAVASDAVTFVVHDTGSMRAEFVGAWAGVVRPRLTWNTTLEVGQQVA